VFKEQPTRWKAHHFTW